MHGADVSRFLTISFTDPAYVHDSGRCLKLLHAFRESMR